MSLKVGLQLYGVRDHMEKDVAATLRAIKEIGYDFVEFAGYFGVEAPEMKAILDEIGLTAISAHQAYESILADPAYYINYYHTLGIRFSAIPWMPAEKQKGAEDYAQTIADITRAGKLLREAGVTQLYHNHDFEFETFDGKLKLEWLYESVPAEFLQTEIDSCWVHYAGYDPCKIIAKYAGRAPIVHLKDYIGEQKGGPVYALIDADGKAMDKSEVVSDFRFAPLGTGKQNMPEILRAAEAAGAQYVVVEQDESYEEDSIASAKKSRDYLNSLGL